MTWSDWQNLVVAGVFLGVALMSFAILIIGIKLDAIRDELTDIKYDLAGIRIRNEFPGIENDEMRKRLGDFALPLGPEKTRCIRRRIASLISRSFASMRSLRVFRSIWNLPERVLPQMKLKPNSKMSGLPTTKAKGSQFKTNVRRSEGSGARIEMNNDLNNAHTL